MRIVDTHCHLYDKAFDPDQDRLMKEAIEAGVQQILMPNENIDSIHRLMDLCNRYPENAFPMMGFHPEEVDQNWAEHLSAIEKQLPLCKYYGIGEIGMDLYWDKTYEKEQKLAFEEQLQWSIDLDLPVSIHNRGAFTQVMDSIHKLGVEKLKGVFHCFTGNEDELDEILKLQNFEIGIGGVITFKNSSLKETLKSCPIERIVLETDAPFLAPVPFRGRRNEPQYITKTAEKLSIIISKNIEEVAEITTKNAKSLFKICKK